MRKISNMLRPALLRVAGGLWGIGLALAGSAVMAGDAFDCAKRAPCDVPREQPYPHLVVGVVRAVATPQEAARLFTQLRQRGWWKHLPADAEAFASKIQPVSIEFATGRSLTLLMSVEEMRAAPVRVGSVSRFSPHRDFDRVDADPNNPYWVAGGCIAQLCTSEDGTCAQDFRFGIYRLPDGRQMDTAGKRAVRHGVSIDTMSMRPVSAAPSLP